MIVPMKPRLPIVAALAALLMALPAFAQQGEPTLKVGDKAPPLAGGEYVKGEPVTEFEEGKVYVLEFWATWCGPCITAIPHVTELQEKYADDGLVIIGQNVWEQDESAVGPFVEEMGDKMNYRVRLDTAPGQQGKMAQTWMMAAGQNGIPCSMIVDRTGTLAWIGHPMQMDEPLEQVMAGTFDPAAAAKAEAAFQELNGELNAAMQGGDIDAAMGVLDRMAQARPAFAPQIAMAKFQILGQADRWEEAYAAADGAIADIDDPAVLNELAWTIVSPDSQLPQKDYDLALKAADKANELSEGKDAAILDTLARAHHAKGNADLAVAFQEQAVAAAEDPQMKAELERTLEEYKSE